MMIISLFFALFISLRKFFLFKNNIKVLKNNDVITLDKNNLYKWMNLTKKERYNLSEKESYGYLNKRRVLLDEIRKEYKKISKGNSTRT